MLKLNLKKLALLALVVNLALPQFSFAAAPEVEFNFQSVYAGPHIFNVETGQPWTKELFEKSGGTIQPHFFMSGTLTKPEEVITGIETGTLDMASGTAGLDPSVFPLAQHVGIPFTYRDAIHSTALANKVYETNPEVKAEIDKVGKLLCIWSNDRSAFFSAKGPINSPADLKGKRVLIWQGNQVDQVKAWGGIPVQVTPNDTYIGIQRGMGDVFFGPLPVGVAYKLLEVTKDITPIPAYVSPIYTWMNWDLWNDLTPEQQKMVEETVNPWGKKTGDDLVRGTNRDIETMKAAGCKFHTLTPESLQVFEDLNIPVTIEYIEKEFKRLNVNKDAKEWIQYIQGVSDTL